MTKRIEDFGITRKMLEQMTWKATFADYLSKLTGEKVNEENVYSDECTEDFPLLPKNLLSNYPLLLVHHTRSLIAVIPHKDYLQLENGDVTPLQYIAGAYWNYGKYSDEEDVSTGIFWKPFEAKKGISETEKIREYLNIIGKLKIHPEDFRQGFFAAIKKRAKKELELNIDDFMGYEGENALLIANSSQKDTITCFLPEILLNDILYHPGERNWEELANAFKFELGVSHNRRRYIIPDNYMGNRAEFCRRTLRNLGFSNRWYGTASTEPKEEKEIQNAKQDPKSGNGTSRIFKFMKEILNGNKNS